ncbi:hypothetical protein E2C01_006950 [Portunus trituberculatus]|uniref:Uncharacterized protein n=1 Tax=Portunus trituberculatus TaxID=210409 RepID=A0A5B7CZ67_PORTR|nr:hypothetical protein [Portunus trituberculatus]
MQGEAARQTLSSGEWRAAFQLSSRRPLGQVHSGNPKQHSTNEIRHCNIPPTTTTTTTNNNNSSSSSSNNNNNNKNNKEYT